MFLKDKVALITGSTSGIGLGVARALAAAGANIMLNGLGDEKAHQSLAESMAKEFGVKVAFNSANLMQADEVRSLVEDTKNKLGPVQILVNNAGIQKVHPIADFPDKDWQDLINLNLSSNFYAIKAAITHMRQSGWGRIINIASVHGLVGSVNKAGYVSAKHGLVGLTKVVALETAEEPITCNAICPGFTRTELIEPQIQARAKKIGATNEDEAIRDLLIEKQPSCTMVKPSDIGALAVFLCSDAAAQMTGSCLPIDGGWTAQ